MKKEIKNIKDEMPKKDFDKILKGILSVPPEPKKKSKTKSK